MNSAPPEGSYVAIGRIIGPLGQDGWAKVEPLTDFPERFQQLEKVYVAEDWRETFPLPLSVGEADVRKDRVLLVFAGITTSERVQELAGQYLLIPQSERVALPEGRYYLDDLKGLRVCSEDGLEVGRIKQVLVNPGNDLLVLETPNGEILLPMVKAFVHQVDLEKGLITATIPPGLEEI